MSTAQIRQTYLDFFQKEGHAVIPSASLLPDNDPTTLFTGSGMQPMLPYLLGEKHPLGTRIADSQKCFRSQDIEEVGDNRHTTYFEMLGNWSLGEYFKKEQIPWMFSFLTETRGLDPSRIYITVFGGNDDVPRDDEAVSVWQETLTKAGINADVIDNAERDGMQAPALASASAAGIARPSTMIAPTPIIAAAIWLSGARSPLAPTEPSSGISGSTSKSRKACSRSSKTSAEGKRLARSFSIISLKSLI